MAHDFSGTDLEDPIKEVTDLLQKLGDSAGGLLDGLNWAKDNPAAIGDGLADALKGLLPGWLGPAAGMNGGGGMWSSSYSPLVLDLNGDGAHSTKLGWGDGASTTFFDMNNDGFAERTAWVASGDGLLAIDRNGNGVIDNQSELFGDTDTYADGFANLASFDSNHDGKITSADTEYQNLRVWVDANGDGHTDAGELKTLSELKITRINLNSIEVDEMDNENAVTDHSTFVIDGKTRNIDEFWFRTDETNTHYMGDEELDVSTLFLPTLRGVNLEINSPAALAA